MRSTDKSSKPVKKRSVAALLAFILVFLALQYVLAQVLTKRNAPTDLARLDYDAADDVDVYFVGNSYCGRSYDPRVLDEELGKSIFAMSVSAAQSSTFYALVKDILTKQTPEMIVVCFDPLGSADDKVEAPTVAAWGAQLISNPLVKAEFVVREWLLNGDLVDRVCPWRVMPCDSLGFYKDNIQILLGQTRKVYAAYKNFARLDPSTGVTQQYVSQGYTSANGDVTWRTNNKSATKVSLKDGARLNTTYYQRIFDLCSARGVRVAVVTTPAHTIKALGDARVRKYNTEIGEFCAAQGVPYYDFTLAKPSLMANVDEELYDFFHLKESGAVIYSQAVAKVLQGLDAGTDMSGWFYDSYDAYAAEVTWVVNTWLWTQEKNGQLLYIADCNCGSEMTPMYKFVQVEPDGTETLLADWSEKRTLTLDPVQGARTVRVYARASWAEDDEAVFYDLTQDADN